jgi:CBS domain containing-hemolysin-like protein
LPVWLLAALGASPVQAAFLAGEALDTAADVLAIVVLILVPVVGIVLFWMVHVLPEKIAHKRHHPQRDAIQTLCLLSLVFGGLLWPLAWLWAYTKPVGYRLAYGTERHDDYYAEMAKKASAGELTAREIALLREELDIAASRGQLSRQQRALRDELPSLHEQAVDAEIAASTPRLAAAEPEAKGVA